MGKRSQFYLPDHVSFNKTCYQSELITLETPDKAQKNNKLSQLKIKILLPVSNRVLNKLGFSLIGSFMDSAIQILLKSMT